VRIGSETHEVTLERQDGGWVARVGGRRVRLDPVPIGPNGSVHLLMDGKSRELGIRRAAARRYRIQRAGLEQVAEVREAWLQRLARERAKRGGRTTQTIRAPIPGTVVRVLVEPGQEVQREQTLLVLEARKMQNEILCPQAGRIRAVHVQNGQSVPADQPLVTLETS